MRRSTRLLVIAGGVAAVGGLLAFHRSHAEPEPPPGADTVTSPEQPPPAQVETYWTPERMRDAEPAPMPEDD